MKVEVRYTPDEGTRHLKPRGLVLVAENDSESGMLDLIFGSAVDNDGLIGERWAECRLSDGIGEHYVYIAASHPSSTRNDRA